jgi:excisionase family DNA binding protein
MTNTFIKPFRGGAMSQEKRWLKPWRVARRLDCSADHVYDLVLTGELEGVQLGKRALRISEASLEQFLSKRRIEPGESGG